MARAAPIWRRLPAHRTRRALWRARGMAGASIATSRAMLARTVRSSTREKAVGGRERGMTDTFDSTMNDERWMMNEDPLMLPLSEYGRRHGYFFGSSRVVQFNVPRSSGVVGSLSVIVKVTGVEGMARIEVALRSWRVTLSV